MASTDTEATPLVPPRPSSAAAPRPPRTVTFNPTVSTSGSAVKSPSTTRPPSQILPSAGSEQEGASAFSALNSKIRRRYSHGTPILPAAPPQPKIGAQRTTRTAQKLKLLPNPDHGEEGLDEESGREVYSQFTRIKDPMARRDAARLGKNDRKTLPRVTAYCTANAYRLDELMKFLRGRGKSRGAQPKLFDECIYTPYSYGGRLAGKGFNGQMESRTQSKLRIKERRYSDSALEVDDHIGNRRDLIDLHTEAGDVTLDNGEDSISNHAVAEMQQPQDPRQDTLDFDTQVHTPEVFLFNYGTVVIWGMTVNEEERFLDDIAMFETEKLGKDDVQTENFNFYYTREYQARIYNDFISLREKRNYMTKLAISHALSQSVKVSSLSCITRDAQLPFLTTPCRLLSTKIS